MLAPRYQLLGRIGAGGMGEVFVAHDTVLDRPVAIKRLRTDVVAASNFGTLGAEARVNARLQHPNIVTVHDVVAENGVDHIVAEFVDGDSLRALVAAARPTIPRAIAILIEIARGLEYAHARKVIHRDLKTENILMGRDGSVKIADFGIAQVLDQNVATETASNGTLPTHVGTPRAMSPEQSHGQPTDARSDLFSVGVLAYEIVSGVSPFHASSNAETIKAVRETRHRPLAEWAPAIPADLSQLVDRLLEKEPSKRPFSAGEVARELALIGERYRTIDTTVAVGLEKRRVTVLCLATDISPGSDAAANDFAHIASIVAREAREMGGELVSTVNGKLVICFGTARTNEHDCEQAAALAMHVLTPRAGERVAFHRLKAGLDVGDIHVAQSEHVLIFGSAVERAYVLANAAGPGELLVTTGVQARLASRYQLVPRSFLRDGNIVASRTETGQSIGACYEVVALANPAKRGVDSSARPLVGRDKVLANVRDELANARNTGGRVVALRGEPGIGKSRLVREFRQEWESRGARVRAFVGLPDRRYTPFAALRPLLQEWFDIDESTLHEESQARVEAVLGDLLESSARADVAVSMRAVCGCASDADRHRLRLLYQQEHRGELEEAVTALLVNASRHEATLIIAEDTHWLDVGSLTVLSRLAAEPRGCTVLATLRPEPIDDWTRSAGVSLHDLPRLAHADAERLVRAGAESALDERVVRRIVEVADGVPLVLEELTRGALSQTDGSYSDPVAGIASSFGDHVAATLEQLGPALRTMLELAALLGISTDRAGLVAISGEGTVGDGHVRALVDRGLLRVREGHSHDLSFTHPLLREEIAAKIPEQRRVELHGRIASHLASSATLSPGRLEQIARHLEGAELVERAIEAWCAAGIAAARDGAHATALEHYDRAMDLVPKCGLESRALALEATVREARGASLAMAFGWGADPVAANSRSLGSALRRGGRPANPVALWQRWAAGYATGNMSGVTLALGDLEDLVEHADVGIFAYLLQCARGITYLHLGRLPSASAALQRALDLQPRYIADLRAMGQPEPILGPSAYLAWTELLVGDRDAAFARQRRIEEDPDFDEALRAGAASFGTTLALAVQDYEGAATRADRVLSPSGAGLALQHRTASAMARQIAFLHRAQKDSTVDVEAVILSMRGAFEEWRAGFMRPGAVVSATAMADVCFAVAVSDVQTATNRVIAAKHGREILDFALNEVRVLDPAIHRYYAAEVFRLEGVVQKRQGDPEEAAAAFREARSRAQRIECGEHGGAWLLLDRISESATNSRA